MKRKLLGWLKLIGVLEIVAIVMSLIGPGSRFGVRRSDDHASIARWLIDDPSYWESFLVNLGVVNLILGVAVSAAHFVGKRKRRREREAED